MELQEYLNTAIEECKIFSKKSEESRNEFPNFFEMDNKDIGKMNKEEMDQLYNISMVIGNTQILFTKVASILYIGKHIGTQLDIEKLSEVQGLTEFVSNYIPFNTDFTTTSEGELEIKNKKENIEKRKEFEVRIKAISKAQDRHES